MARLIQRTEHGEIPHELLFQSTSIGRGRLNDIVIEDPSERRLHAEVLSLGKGRYALRDNRSRGGVTVNGERVDEKRDLADGDVVRVGGAEFLLAAGEEPSAAARPAPRAGGTVQLTVGTLISRVFGYARELVATAYFGLSSGIYDAYVAASTIPNLFRDVLGEQAAESAFMPAHLTLTSRGRKAEADRLLRSVLSVVVIAATILVVLCIWAAPWLVLAVVPGFEKKHPELMSTTIWLARWMMPFLLVIAVASVYGSLLLADRRFWRYSMAPIAASVLMVIAVVFLKQPLNAGCLAVGVVAGGVVQMWVSAVPYLRRGQWRQLFRRPLVDARQAALRKVARSSIPIALAAILSRLASLVDRILASVFCTLGSISALYEAFRLLQLPFGVFGLAVSRAAFPSMIERASAQDGEGFSRAVVRALRLNLFFMLPATVGMIALATPLVQVLYQRGQFSADDTELTALALVCYSVGLVSMGSRTVLTRAFYALLNTRTPFYVSLVAVPVNTALSAALVLTSLAHGGLALATSLISMLQAWLLTWLLGRDLARHGRRLDLTGLWPAILRMGAAGAAMALCTWACVAGLDRLGLAQSFFSRAFRLLVTGTGGMAAYLAVAALLGCEEIHSLRRRASTRNNPGSTKPQAPNAK